MATAYKVLGQTVSQANTLTTLYAVPVARSAVCSTLAICNMGLIATFRVAIRPLGATIQDANYIAYNSTISPGDTIFLTLGITLGATDVISVYSSTSTVTFNLFGSEIF